MKRLLILIVAVLIVCGVAFAGREADPRLAAAALCTPKPTLMQRGTMIASKAGSIVPALNKPLPYDKIEETARGAWFTLGYWAGVFGAAVQGRPTPEPVLEPVDCTTLLDPCAVPQGLGGNATLQNSVRSLSGAALAADALRKAGFPASEIPTFVAIADAESGFNPNAWNNVGAGMAGMWQLNQQYWRLENWRDPYANAVMAKKVRDESVANGNSPWYPWSTWRTAVANASKYASLSNSPTPNTTPPVTGSITTPDCDPSAAGGPATVGQWNVWYRNSTARINEGAGFADLVCLNEIRHNSALKVPGYQVSPGKMAVPIIWKPSKLDRLELHRTTVLTGYARDKSVVHGVWRNRATGKSFAALCTHMLVQGGSGWRKQAAAVNRLRDGYRKRGLPVMVLADMNAPQPKVLDFFAGKPTGGRIDFMVTYGMPQPKMSKLSNGGSDHARRLFTFPPDSGTGSATVGGGVTPSRFDQQGNPRTVEQAIAWFRSRMPNGNGYAVSNLCERFVTLAYGHDGGYPTAIAHWNATGDRTPGMATPPRGALVYWRTGNAAGHVALSLGGGQVISTDFDGSKFSRGTVGVGPLSAIDQWGPRLGYRPPKF